jgi:hypothetical protein
VVPDRVDAYVCMYVYVCVCVCVRACMFMYVKVAYTPAEFYDTFGNEDYIASNDRVIC